MVETRNAATSVRPNGAVIAPPNAITGVAATTVATTAAVAVAVAVTNGPVAEAATKMTGGQWAAVVTTRADTTTGITVATTNRARAAMTGVTPTTGATMSHANLAISRIDPHVDPVTFRIDPHVDPVTFRIDLPADLATSRIGHSGLLSGAAMKLSVLLNRHRNRLQSRAPRNRPIRANPNR